MNYLEIVTPDVDAVCATYASTNGLTFGDPEPDLGNARTAESADGYQVGVRAPMHNAETPVVRPYWLVDDIESAVKSVVDAGAELALPPMDMAGRGRIAIYLVGGVQHGLWQV